MTRILYADDSSEQHELWNRFHEQIEKAFQGQCGLDAAFSFAETLEKLASKEYDALILDLVIPPGGVDEGVKFIETHHAKLPIIALTGHEDIFIRRRCMIAGAADFWTKRDAQMVPDVFFKCLYNQYVKRYAAAP